ncbi:hypothetical protein CR513_03235, partial [Mucuna pruriens]
MDNVPSFLNNRPFSVTITDPVLEFSLSSMTNCRSHRVPEPCHNERILIIPCFKLWVISRWAVSFNMTQLLATFKSSTNILCLLQIIAVVKAIRTHQIWKFIRSQGSPLVETSATWSPVGSCALTISPLSNCSLMKCLSISMCFVLSCWTRLWTILIAELLSQNNFIGPSYFTLRSSRIIFIDNPSHIPCAMAQNSTSVLDQATIFCFLLLKVTRFPPRNIQYPEYSPRLLFVKGFPLEVDLFVGPFPITITDPVLKFPLSSMTVHRRKREASSYLESKPEMIVFRIQAMKELKDSPPFNKPNSHRVPEPCHNERILIIPCFKLWVISRWAVSFNMTQLLAPFKSSTNLLCLLQIIAVVKAIRTHQIWKFIRSQVVLNKKEKMDGTYMATRKREEKREMVGSKGKRKRKGINATVLRWNKRVNVKNT